MPKKPSRKTLIKNLDKAVSEYIRKRDGQCVQCGTQERLTNGHIFTRRYHSTRWDISIYGNNHCQCWSHNFSHTYQPYEYYKWYINKFGQKKFDKLYRRHKTVQKFKNHELQELLDEIKSHISR